LKAEDGQTSFFQQATQLLSQNFKGPKEYSPGDILVVLRSRLFRLFVVLLPDMDNPGHTIVAGAAFVAIYSQHRAMHLEYLAVNNRFQGVGLGKLITQWLINYGKEAVAAETTTTTTTATTSQKIDDNRRTRNISSSEQDLRFVILTLECKSDLLNFYHKLGAQDSGLTQVWQIDYGGGELVTHTHHFLYFSLQVDLKPNLPSSTCGGRRCGGTVLVTEIRKDLEVCHELADRLISSTRQLVC